MIASKRYRFYKRQSIFALCFETPSPLCNQLNPHSLTQTSASFRVMKRSQPRIRC